MLKQMVWLLPAAVLLLSVGCSAQAVQNPAENSGALEPTAEMRSADTPTAEALKKILESPLLETPTQAAETAPILDEMLELKPTSSKPDAEAQQHIQFARHDLAGILEIDISAVALVRYEEAIWRDGSLGCPQPGMMYTQALVDGYVIELSADGVSFYYHGANGRDPFLCTNNMNPEDVPSRPRGGQLATPPGAGIDE